MIKKFLSTIKGQLLIGFILLCTLMLFYFFINHKYKHEENNLKYIQLSISKSVTDMLSIRRYEKDFIDRMDNKYIDLLNNSKDSLSKKIQKIEQDINNNYIESDILFSDIYHAIGQYDAKFNEFVILRKSLYSKVKDTDNLLFMHSKLNNELFNKFKDDKDNNSILYLTKASDKINNFLLYPNLNNKKSAEFEIEKLLKNSQYEPSIYRKIINYSNNFNDISNTYEKMGFDYQSGLHYELRNTMHNIEDKLNYIQKILPKNIDKRLIEIENNLHTLALLTIFFIFLTLIHLYRKISFLEKEIIISKTEAIKANNAKSTFLSNMSHEIRTPLNGIIGMSEILSDTNLNINQKEYLSILNSSSHSLLSLINDILDLSKIESGKLDIINHPTKVRKIIYDSVSLNINKIRDKQLALKVIIPSNIPDTINIDDQRLRQILINLISNAVKFTEEGEIVIQVKMIKDNSMILFSVKDTGIGIDTDKQSYIFDPFIQADNTITRKFGGTGLGLNICQLLISKMNGALSIESKKGVGSEFSFELPINIIRSKPKLNKDLNKYNILFKIETDYIRNLMINELSFYNIKFKEFTQNYDCNIFIYEHINDKETKEIISKIRTLKKIKIIIVYDIFNPIDNIFNLADSICSYPIFGDKIIDEITSLDSNNFDIEEAVIHSTSTKVLLVEDNIVNQKVAKLHLKNKNYIVDVADNGLDALNKIKNGQSYDIILMDCMMPEMDGFTATLKIREYEKDRQKPRTPIIALTASVLEKDIKKCIDSGMDKYLSKPLKKEILFNTISEFISEDINS